MRISSPRMFAVAVAGLALMLTSSIHAAPPCNADLDDDGQVGTSDLLLLFSSWGPCEGCVADLNGDGSVNTSDILELFAGWGPTQFEFADGQDDAEAQQIAIEMLGAGGPLNVPTDIYERVDRDLDLIRAAVPDLISQLHSPAWVEGQILAQILENEPQQEYLCLNEYYQVINLDNFSSNLWLITFADNINIPALAPIYAATPAVSFAEPNGIFGGQNFWTPTDFGGGLWQWVIDDGWHDCFDGCDCHRVYTIRTDSKKNVQIISIEEFGQPWCDFGG
ncbi:MAG: hypothetical protein IH984_05075 [Planctomycetes bacterium]|nr:hypothetical protein [Planctomycetota bacterium]